MENTEAGKKRIVTSNQENEVPQEILVVASKVKNYIRAKSHLNTSANVMEKVSDIVRELCDRAITSAKQDGRKTVMDRDFQKVLDTSHF